MYLHRAAIFAFAIMTVSCGQSDGEPCQVDDDCSSGLECTAMTGRGVCRPIGTVPDAGPIRDAGPVPDAEPVDAASPADAAPPEDAGNDADVTGCTGEDACDETTFCDVAACDDTGACAPRPTDCPGIFDPVCGCDGVEYVNACEAEGAGVTVDATGDACGSADAGRRDAGT